MNALSKGSPVCNSKISQDSTLEKSEIDSRLEQASKISAQAKSDYINLHLGKNLSYFKSRADKLYKQLLQAQSPVSEELNSRLAQVSQLFILDKLTRIKRKDAFRVIALEHGFIDWAELKRWIELVSQIDFSTFFCRSEFCGFTNHWFNSYGEAKTHHESNGGVLLSYKLQFFVTTMSYLEAMGFGREDPDWVASGFDWVNPENVEAKWRIIEKLLKRYATL